MLNLPGPVPAEVLSLVHRVILDCFVPGVEMLGVATHREGFHQQRTRIVARAGESLAAVRELLFSLANVRQNQRFE